MCQKERYETEWIHFFLPKFKNTSFMLKALFHTCAAFLAMTCRHGSEVPKTNCQDPEIPCHVSLRACIKLSGISYWINCSNKPKM